MNHENVSPADQPRYRRPALRDLSEPIDEEAETNELIRRYYELQAQTEAERIIPGSDMWRPAASQADIAKFREEELEALKAKYEELAAAAEPLLRKYSLHDPSVVEKHCKGRTLEQLLNSEPHRKDSH